MNGKEIGNDGSKWYLFKIGTCWYLSPPSSRGRLIRPTARFVAFDEALDALRERLAA